MTQKGLVKAVLELAKQEGLEIKTQSIALRRCDDVGRFLRYKAEAEKEAAGSIIRFGYSRGYHQFSPAYI